jgi:hypothetical protein
MPRRQPNFLSDEDEFYTGVGNKMEARVDSKSRGVAGELGFGASFGQQKLHGEFLHNQSKTKHHKPRGLAKAVFSLAHREMARIKHDYRAPSLMATEFHQARELLKELDGREKDDASTVHIPSALAHAAVSGFNAESDEVAEHQLKHVNKIRAKNEASGKPRRPRKDGKEHTTGPITIDKISKLHMESPVNSGGGDYDIKVARNFLHKLIKKIPLLYYNLIHYSTHDVSRVADTAVEHHTKARDEHQTKFYNDYHYIRKELHKAKHGARGHHGKGGGDGNRKKRTRKPREPRPSRG